MPREGRNPNKDAPAALRFPRVLTAVITHLPHEEGYHAGRFEVVKKCLTTMRVANVPVLVWDNGSCGRLLDWLQTEYKPDWLMLCRNVGKQAAWAAICRMLPPDTLVGLSDDDMEFMPGWLDASLDLFNTFPNVGVVSAWAVRVSMTWGNKHTLAWAAKEAQVESGYFIPLDEVRDYYSSTGGDAKMPDKSYQNFVDYRITYNGKSAYACAQHCQFVGRAGTLAPFTRFWQMAMGKEREFDEAIDAAGLLRLTTTKQYARHLGNRL